MIALLNVRFVGRQRRGRRQMVRSGSVQRRPVVIKHVKPALIGVAESLVHLGRIEHNGNKQLLVKLVLENNRQEQAVAAAVELVEKLGRFTDFHRIFQIQLFLPIIDAIIFAGIVFDVKDAGGAGAVLIDNKLVFAKLEDDIIEKEQIVVHDVFDFGDNLVDRIEFAAVGEFVQQDDALVEKQPCHNALNNLDMILEALYRIGEILLVVADDFLLDVAAEERERIEIKGYEQDDNCDKAGQQLGEQGIFVQRHRK